MCGVIGIFECGPNPVDQLSMALPMAQSIRHRGPDDEGFAVFGGGASPKLFWSDDTPLNVRSAYPEADNARAANIESRALLGHRRLSILDTSPSGHQPMQNQDGRYHIVFNGEIYNYIELRSELVAMNYTFKTNSDTEVILAAYEKWGPDCTSRFNGDWAILLYDNLEGKLFASRDRFGIKPLYYYQDDSRLIFASEIKALLANPHVKSEPDLDALSDYLATGNKEWQETTVFKNIQRFPLGHSAQIDLKDLNSWQPTQYYTLNASTANERFDPVRAEAFAQEYLALLTDAVRIRLRSDVPVGFALSGGLDSSSIVFLADQLLKQEQDEKKLNTFSMVHRAPETKHYDESSYIDLLQDNLGFNSFRCEPVEADVPELLQEVLRVMESPPDGLATAGIVTVGAAKAAGLVVTLDGQGADEVQAGYQHYQASYLGDLNIRDFPAQFWEFHKNYEGPSTRRFLISFAALGLKIFGKNWTNRFARLFGIRSEIKSDSLNIELLNSVNHGLVNLIHYADARSMYHSIESRMPFMDHRLIEFSLSVPACYKIHNGYTKYFARLAFDGKLPDEITWRKDKMGWPVPIAEWFEGPLGAWTKTVLAQSNLLRTLKTNTSEQSKAGISVSIKLLNVAIWDKVFWAGSESGMGDVYLKNNSFGQND